MIKQEEYNPNVHCDVCHGSGEPNLNLFPHASQCYYCEGSGLLPLCKFCKINGVWSTSNSCIECEDIDHGGNEFEEDKPSYRSHVSQEIEVEISINPDSTIELLYYSDLSGVTSYQYKKIVDATESKRRYFMAFPKSTVERFSDVKASFLGSLI